MQKLRSSFAKDIFAQDLLCLYEKQTEHRNRLRSESKDVLAEIVSQINSGEYSNPHLEELLLQFALRLSRTKDKKVYGYLKADVKAIVDSIVDELAKDNRISTLYNLWYEQRENALSTYYKGNAAGSVPEYSFHWNGRSDRLYLFEAPIDMLSFISMNKGGWLCFRQGAVSMSTR